MCIFFIFFILNWNMVGFVIVNLQKCAILLLYNKSRYDRSFCLCEGLSTLPLKHLYYYKILKLLWLSVEQFL